MIAWKQIESLPYEVSDTGLVRRIETGRHYKASLNKDGYRVVVFTICGKNIGRRVARLVAAAFIGPIPEGLTVNHIDGNKTNDTIENLEIVSLRENLAHATRLGLRAFGIRNGAYTKPHMRRAGINHGQAKLTPDAIASARKDVSAGRSISEIARKLGVARATLRCALSGKTWKGTGGAA